MKKLLTLISACILILQLSGCKVTSTGEKVGILTKVSRDGFIFSTWEAELIRGGMQGGSGSFGVKPFDFSIDDDLLIPRVKQALENQQEVKIKYHCEWISAVWRGETSCYL